MSTTTVTHRKSTATNGHSNGVNGPANGHTEVAAAKDVNEPAPQHGYGAFGMTGHTVSWPRWFAVLSCIVGVPLIVYWCWICVEYNSGHMLLPKSISPQAISDWIFAPKVGIFTRIVNEAMPTWAAWRIYLLWTAFQAVLFYFAPGHEQFGVVLKDGTRIKYRFNGQFAFFTTIIVAAYLHFSGLWRLTALIDLFPQMLTVCIIFTSAVIALIHIVALINGTVENQTDSLLYDYFMGAQLNPFIYGFDIKFFFELRPGIMHWFFTTIAFMAKQYEETETVQIEMILICFYHLCFVNACYKGEHCVPWSMDIIHEKFGWMLCMLDLVMVPFVFPMQAYYVYKVQPHHELWYIILVASMHCIGYYMFDTANSQKDYFRENPNEAVPSGFPRLPWGRLTNPKYLQTKRGTKLLVDGWWKYARHMNYFGDMLMSWSWGLTCNTPWLSVFPYAYTCYLTPLLIHREIRDDIMCATKYGADWEKYKKLVPYRICPYVY